MVAILFLIVLLVYIILSWMIVYHLRTYTINKRLARRATRFFLTVTAVLVVVQMVLFVVSARTVSREVTPPTVPSDAFSSPF